MTPQRPSADTVGRSRWMLVDDNQELLSFMKAIVTRLFGVEVAVYRSGSDALAAFQAAPAAFQYVITDLEMPAMDGFELCNQLHAVDPRIKVLLTTGSHSLTAEEARAKGFCGLLNKPFSCSALQREIASIAPGDRN